MGNIINYVLPTDLPTEVRKKKGTVIDDFLHVTSKPNLKLCFNMTSILLSAKYSHIALTDIFMIGISTYFFMTIRTKSRYWALN